MSPHLSRHVDNDDPRHYTFARQTHLPVGYFDETLGARIERLGGRAMSITMSLVAIFIVLGLTFGWFA